MANSRLCEHCGIGTLKGEARRYCSPGCYHEAITRSAEERFWRRVDTSGGPDACWIWKGHVNNHGYGRIGVNPRGDEEYCHRYSYRLSHGDVPAGMCVLHRCDNPRCVNPRHLFLGTKMDNVIDMHAKGRARHGGAAGRKGGDCSLAKLTTEDVRAIRALHVQGSSFRALGRRFGVNATTIADVVKRKTWDHIT